MLQLGDGVTAEDLSVEEMRDYLNGLVEESAARKSDQVCCVLSHVLWLLPVE